MLIHPSGAPQELKEKKYPELCCVSQVCVDVSPAPSAMHLHKNCFLSKNSMITWQMCQKSYIIYMWRQFPNLNKLLRLHGSFLWEKEKIKKEWSQSGSVTIFSTCISPMSMKDSGANLTVCEDNILWIYDPWPSKSLSRHGACCLWCSLGCVKALMTLDSTVWLCQPDQLCINLHSSSLCVHPAAWMCHTGGGEVEGGELRVCVYVFNPGLLNYKSLQLSCAPY